MGVEKSIKIAIIDSGIDSKHEYFQNSIRIKSGYNFINHQLPPNDEVGHGTAVAGMINSVLDDRANYEIYPLKVFDSNGTADNNAITAAIKWCIANKIDIVNMSFAMDEVDEQIEESIEQASSNNVVLIAASDLTLTGGIGFPASSKYVLSINSLDGSLEPTAPFIKGKIDYSAIGEMGMLPILNNEYRDLEGTSIAAANASGIIAKILAGKETNEQNMSYLTKELKERYHPKFPSDTYGKRVLNEQSKRR